jgi:hypothetical protein
MVIYQLHECGGEWEDYYDHIIGSYLRKERAEEEKAKAEAKEKVKVEKGNKCKRCPFMDVDFEDFGKTLLKHPDYCNKSNLVYKGSLGVSCKKYYFHWDESSFKIEEVEVE